jgi:hypothetical protein
LNSHINLLNKRIFLSDNENVALILKFHAEIEEIDLYELTSHLLMGWNTLYSRSFVVCAIADPIF